MALQQVTMSMSRRMTDMTNPIYRWSMPLVCLYIRQNTFEMLFARFNTRAESEPETIQRFASVALETWCDFQKKISQREISLCI